MNSFEHVLNTNKRPTRECGLVFFRFLYSALIAILACIFPLSAIRIRDVLDVTHVTRPM